MPVFAASAVAALLSAGSALAALGGYGGPPASATGVPAGFSHVVIVRTISQKGGVVRGHGVSVSVPRGVGVAHLQVAITGGNSRIVNRYRERSLRGRRLIGSFGVLLLAGSHTARTRKAITVTFSSRRIRRHDVVAIYSAKFRSFRKVRARVVNGKIVVRLKAGEAIAVLS